MQEVQHPWTNTSLKEYFAGESDAAVRRKMDQRRDRLIAQGYTFVRRVKIGRNEPCPCGSGLKFKRCHINNVEALNTTERVTESAVPTSEKS